MSTSSVRRLKERGGGGGTKITAVAAISSTAATKHPKFLNPQSEKSTLSNDIGGREGFKRPTGKENPRPTSRGRAATTTETSQKPVLKAMPRIDKSSAANGGSNYNGFGSRGDSRAEPRARWSTSSASVQRGRSSSPSEFNRGSSNPRASRISSQDQKRPNPKVSEKCEIGKLDWKNSKKSGEICEKKEVNLMRNSTVSKLGDFIERPNLKGNLKVGAFVGNVVELGEKDLKLMDKSGSSSGISKEGILSELRVKDLKIEKELGIGESRRERDISEFSVKDSLSASRLNSSAGMLKEKDGDLSVKETKMANKSEILREKYGNGDGKCGLRTNVKYPSKLHEKLAFLEGKVKRIASDIKRTKDMLDMNNPDSSKVILSDIQEKISGIEKAMSHVSNYEDTKNSLEKDNGMLKQLENRQESQVAEEKSSVKGLNADELEARLFPHHKLLRDRTSLKSSSGSSHNHEIEVKTDGQSKVEEESDVPIDENPIAVEFLASLSKEQSGETIRNVAAVSEISEVQEMDGAVTSATENSVLNFFNGKGIDLTLMTDERLEEFDNQENMPAMVIEEESEDSYLFQLNEIGHRTTTGGWFVSEGESVLLAHDDGSCSFYDVANCEEKSLYKPPNGVSPNMWRDCWLIRAPSADGCSGRYIVAASAGNSMVPGFCSWDFYTKDVRAFHTENGAPTVRTALAPLANDPIYRRNVSATSMLPENQQWWYRPCGPLIVSAASCQREIRIYDIRDGEDIMKWDLQKPVVGMDHSSPLQWRNRGKVVVAELDAISLWDVSSLNPQALLSISSSTRRIVALHVNNTDAELGGGVRQRVSSSEAEGHDGVFCTSDSINVLDFRHPTGIGAKIPKVGLDVQSVFSRGDSVFMGGTNLKSAGKKQYCSQIQQFSLRKQRLHSTYVLPESNSHPHFTAITQVWGNSGLVMGVNGLGLFVFDALKDDGLQSSSTVDCHNTQNVREIIGPDDLYSPSFDYLASRVLLVSRDRPALWRYLS